MAETGVQYTITVNKTGTGAAEVGADFSKLQASAAKVNQVFAQSETATASLHKGFKAFHGVLTIAGLQTFPQLTAGVMVTKQAIDGLRASQVQLQAGLGLTALSIAGLTALVLTGIQAWMSYKAQAQEATSAKNLDEQTTEFAARIKDQLDASRAAGDITIQTYQKLSSVLGSLAGNKQVTDFFRDMRQGDAGTLISEQQRGFANTRAQLAYSNPKSGSTAAQAIQVQSEYNDQVKLYNVLRADGLITEQQLTAMTMEADTNRMNSLVQLRSHLTELQQLGRSVAETFATGLSGALVKAFTEGGKAFQEFASSFMAQVAQMILQMLILRAISGIMGGAVGGATGAGTSMSATFMAAGGVRYAASGLAGVGTVASPTYLPRFNVIAGEAGREMLTVLARPRMMEVGGMQAVVGSAQGRQLAITNASDLARGGAGGAVDIRVTLGPELRAEIVNESVQGARVTVAQDMRTDSPISRGVKGLTA